MEPNEQQREYFGGLARQFLKELPPDIPHQDLILRMLTSVLRMSGDARRADLKLTTAALEEMEHAFDILERYAEARKVALFGSARIPEGSPIYRQVLEFSEQIVRQGFMVITGAGPGVMAAGNQGAGRENSFGMNLRLPYEAACNEFIAGDDKLIEFKYFFTRKLAFLKDSHAMVAFPGGYGTHDEAFETLTLIQTGKAQLLPVVLMQSEGSRFWNEWDEYIRRNLLEPGLISEPDLSFYKITSSVQEACDEICGFYRRYHSMRFHGQHLLLRLGSPTEDAELEQLNLDFADILREGVIERCSPPPAETLDSDLSAMPHIRLQFKHGRFGRLRQLIDRLNASGPTRVVAPPDRGEGGRMPVETDSPARPVG